MNGRVPSVLAGPTSPLHETLDSPYKISADFGLRLEIAGASPTEAADPRVSCHRALADTGGPGERWGFGGFIPGLPLGFMDVYIGELILWGVWFGCSIHGRRQVQQRL